MVTDQHLTEEAKEKILHIFNDVTSGDFWKTPEEISLLTKLSLDQVSQIMLDGDFFQSRNSRQEFVYTTKENFRKYQSFGKKILGAFKNRID